MKTNWIRKIVGGLSFTSALFIFQACYGTPQDLKYDILIEGQVKSMSSGLPIQGIRVSAEDNIQYELTNQEGKFSFYMFVKGDINLQFKDTDALQNGQFEDKDTLVTNVGDRIYLDILLKEK